MIGLTGSPYFYFKIYKKADTNKTDAISSATGILYGAEHRLFFTGINIHILFIAKGAAMQLSHIQKDLEKRVKGLAMLMFGWKMDKPVVISGRMKRTLGQYVWKINHETKKPALVKFQFAAKLFTGGYKEEDIDWVIKHELIHWYTDITEGKPCHHNKVWKANCKKFGVPYTRSINPEDSETERDFRWQYQCSNPGCGLIFKRYRRIPKNYVCGKCRSRLKEYFLNPD